MLSTQLRHILRRLAHSPVFTGMTLLTLALGAGATTAIFSVVNGVLLKPLAFDDPGSLVAFWLKAPKIGITDLNPSPAVYFTAREESKTFQSVALWSSESDSVTGIGEPEEVESLTVTHEFLPLLGVQPAYGRNFTPAEDSPKGAETVLLGNGYWQRRFASDPNIIGRKLLVNGKPREIIGVLPARFRFMNLQPALIVPFRLNRGEARLGNFSFHGIARLKPGATLGQASADVERMLGIMFQRFPAPPGLSVKAFFEAGISANLRLLKEDVVGEVEKVLWVIMATVAMVLFIACANVANLLLVRASGRQQELAVRAALGAGRGQIAREMLLESIVIGVLGGILGLGVAQAALRLLLYLAPAGLPRLDEITMDGRVLVFAFAISIVAGLLFGLVPVLKYGAPVVGTALRAGGRSASQSRERHRTRSALVVVQVALALVLLVGSGLMLRTLAALRGVQPGFTNAKDVLTLRVSISNAQVPEADAVARMQKAILEKIAALPGVTSVTMANSVPMDQNRNNDPIFAEDRTYTDSQVPPIRRFKHIAPGYFRTMGNPILVGRDLTWTDIEQRLPLTIISDNLAREMWGSPAAALGKRIRENPKGPWREIIAVVGNERDDGADQKAPAIVYWPYVKADFWGDKVDIRRAMTFAIRSNRTGTRNFLNDVQQAVWSVNPDLPLASVRTLDEIYQRSMARSAFTFVMIGIAAGLALVLGVVGIYGVISYSITQRTKEIGIRIALGAPHSNVRGLFVRNGLTLAGIGVACGTAAAIPLTGVMQSLLYEVSPVDPLTYAAVAAVLLGSALLAAYLPARRATKIAPVEALRGD